MGGEHYHYLQYRSASISQMSQEAKLEFLSVFPALLEVLKE
jgi:hypothetical protein